ncbi:hypothetical protein ACIA8R_14900 [Nonomuraea sp. NPDC051191]|uniref:hypothetical protein n=1 Tax=Nonomuraea sp. NPDC051191 TaxID=3364372 RepID=UPI0037AC1E82
MKPIMKLTTAVAVTALSMGMVSTTAQASERVGTARVSSVTASAAASLAGGCQAAKSNWGNIKAYYYTQGKYDYFNRINWFLGGPGLRNKNNVRLRIRLERRGLPDKTIWSYTSGDNVSPGSGGRPVPNLRVKRSDKVHVDFNFVFDRSGKDPHCGDRTNSL